MSVQSTGELLGADGPFSRSLPGFLPRAPQQEMADAVAQALSERSALVVRVVISTGTKNLQDQLFFRDLPRVRDALAVPARVSLLKGRANYLCLYRLRKAQLDPRGRVRRDRLQAVDEWAHRTSTGEMSELGSIGNDDPLLPAVTSTADNCLGAKCPDFGECHVVKARRAAQGADLVVVNHHLLFSDYRLKQEGFGVLPGAEGVIIDEAHQLPELAAQFFGERVSTRQLLDLVRDSGTELQSFRDMPDLTEAIDALAIAATELERPFLELGGRLAWRQFGELPGAASALGAARTALSDCRDELRGAAERSPGIESCAQRAHALCQRLDAIAATASTADNGPPQGGDNTVRWVEAQGRGGALHSAPVEPTEGFRNFMAAYPGAWVFTSATLAAGGDFSHFKSTLGLDQARTLRLDSPFDYPRQARLYLPSGLPDPNSIEHSDAVADALIPLIEAAGGGAFVLCTSHRALARIAARLRNTAFPLFVQGEDGKAALVERFTRAGNGVLVATSSFWEGVDVKGSALRLVAIDKLPFGQQNDPVFEARLEAVRLRGGNPFSEVQLPRAITALRQGVGRLIRDDADHGLVVICDPRIRAKGYGRRVLAALPPMPLLADAEAARAWLLTLKAAR